MGGSVVLTIEVVPARSQGDALAGLPPITRGTSSHDESDRDTVRWFGQIRRHRVDSVRVEMSELPRRQIRRSEARCKCLRLLLRHVTQLDLPRRREARNARGHTKSSSAMVG